MSKQRIRLNVGQRVRIIEEEDPPVHLGKMAIIERVKLPAEGGPICDIRIDRSSELVSLSQ